MATAAEVDIVAEEQQQPSKTREKYPQLIHIPTLLATVPLLVGQIFVGELLYHYYPDAGLTRVRAAWAVVGITLGFGFLFFLAVAHSFHVHDISNETRKQFLLVPFILFLYTLQVAIQEIFYWKFPDSSTDRVVALLITTVVSLMLAAILCLICCNWCDKECMQCAWVDRYYYRDYEFHGRKYAPVNVRN